MLACGEHQKTSPSLVTELCTGASFPTRLHNHTRCRWTCRSVSVYETSCNRRIWLLRLFPLILPATIPLWQVVSEFYLVLSSEGNIWWCWYEHSKSRTYRKSIFFAYPAEISGDNAWLPFNVKGTDLLRCQRVPDSIWCNLSFINGLRILYEHKSLMLGSGFG